MMYDDIYLKDENKFNTNEKVFVSQSKPVLRTAIPFAKKCVKCEIKKEYSNFSVIKLPNIKHEAKPDNKDNVEIRLTKDQQKALDIMNSGQNVFLSGEAGTGKSFVLNEFIKQNDSKNIIVCAPTGIAAINVGGTTIHRLFNIPKNIIKPKDYNMWPDPVITAADIVIIDEISMCRVDLFEYVVRTLEKSERISARKIIPGRKSSDILKTKQLIVVGDFYQLSPVVNSKERDILKKFWGEKYFGDGYAFLSPLWEKLNFHNVILKEIVRQKGDDEYIENLNKIRVGDYQGIDWFNKHAKMEAIANSIYLCGTNGEANAINIRESKAIKGKEMDYIAVVNGKVAPNEKATTDVLTLKVGMQVMTLVNDVMGKYQNGSIGKIIALNYGYVTVRFNDGECADIKPYSWEVIDYKCKNGEINKIKIGEFKQIPLKIAYAVTIHKSQGKTYRSANISPKCFADGQLYVALSRVQSIDGVSLKYPISKSSLKTSDEVKGFYKNILNPKTEESSKKEGISKDILGIKDKIQKGKVEEPINLDTEPHNPYWPWTKEEEKQLILESKRSIFIKEDIR